jgi:hypothetical protein
MLARSFAVYFVFVKDRFQFLVLIHVVVIIADGGGWASMLTWSCSIPRTPRRGAFLSRRFWIDTFSLPFPAPC